MKSKPGAQPITSQVLNPDTDRESLAGRQLSAGCRETMISGPQCDGERCQQ